MRRSVVLPAVGGLLAVSALVGSAVLITGGDSSQNRALAQEPSSAAGVEYQRAAPKHDVSRDTDRQSLAELKAEAMAEYSRKAAQSDSRVTVDQEKLATSDSDPREIAQAMLPQYGWDSSQFGCLDDLWYGESKWDPSATNPYTGAYGIPQALPGEKMATAGPDWETNPATQIEWGLGYIQDRYGSPCGANDFKLANGWY